MNISNSAHAELEEVAKKHSRFDTFRDEVLRHAEVVWHNVRSRGDQTTLEVARIPAETPVLEVEEPEDEGPESPPSDPTE